jgi:hypothetical protein
LIGWGTSFNNLKRTSPRKASCKTNPSNFNKNLSSISKNMQGYSSHPRPSTPPSYGASEETIKEKDRQQWPCNYENCKVILYSKSSRFRHLKLHENPESQYKCNQCSLSFLMKLDLMDHERRSHMSPSSYVVCNQCERTFSSISNLNAHFEIIHVKSKTALRQHQQNDHNQMSDDQKDYHWRKFSGISSPLQSKENKSYYHAIDRSQTSTPPSQTCLICNGIFSSDYEFHQHLGAIHYLSPQLTCIINNCNVQIWKKTDLEIHQREHPHFHN